MLINPPPKFAKRNKRRKTLPLLLVSVTWNTDDGVLSLEFDRAISMANLNPAGIRLNGGVTTNQVLGPYPPILVQDATKLVMSVTDVSAYAGSDVLLTVSADNGIVAIDDGGRFAGAIDLPVPFPSI